MWHPHLPPWWCVAPSHIVSATKVTEMDIDDDLSPVKIRPKMNASEFRESLVEHSGASEEAVQKLVSSSSARELLRSTTNGLWETIIDCEYSEPDKKKLKLFVFSEAGKLAELRREQERAASTTAMDALAEKAGAAAASAAAAATAANSASASAASTAPPARASNNIAYADRARGKASAFDECLSHFKTFAPASALLSEAVMPIKGYTIPTDEPLGGMKNRVRPSRELLVKFPFHAKNEVELFAAFTTKDGESGCFYPDADNAAGGMLVSVDLRPQRLSSAPQLQLVGQVLEWITPPCLGRSAPMMGTLGFDTSVGNTHHSAPCSLICSSFELGADGRFQLVEFDTHPTVPSKTLELRTLELSAATVKAIGNADKNFSSSYEDGNRPSTLARSNQTRNVAPFDDPPEGLELERSVAVVGKGTFAILLIVGTSLSSEAKQRLSGIYNQLAALNYHVGFLQLPHSIVETGTAASTIDDTGPIREVVFDQGVLKTLREIAPSVDALHFDLESCVPKPTNTSDQPTRESYRLVGGGGGGV